MSDHRGSSIGINTTVEPSSAPGLSAGERDEPIVSLHYSSCEPRKGQGSPDFANHNLGIPAGAPVDGPCFPSCVPSGELRASPG